MRGIFVFLLLLCGSLVAPASGHAQYAEDQPQSLRGLRKVYVNFADLSAEMPATTASQLYEYTVLELRKVGVRVVRDASELDLSRDGILNVGFEVATGWTDAIRLRMDVEQHVTLARTGARLQLVTWYYEESERAPTYRDRLDPMLRQGVDAFLSQWLDANGR